MAKALPRVEIWKRQGTGAFTSWNDILDLGRRADGSFRLRLQRVGLDDPGTSYLYCSSPFRTGERLLKELRELHHAPNGKGSRTLDLRPLSLSEVVRAVAGIALFDAAFAADALRALAADLHKNKTDW